MTTLTVTFLGTGTSNGIPVIGCDCAVCHSTDPRDRRTRSSITVHVGDRVILIDTAPELRLQALAVGLRRVDAVLFTHAHADHVAGFDDLRQFNYLAQSHLPVYAAPDTARELRQRFGYAFEDQFPFYGGKPDLILHEITGPFELFGQEIIPIPVPHGRWTVLGFRFGPFAYITDAATVPESALAALQGVQVLVLNALRARRHPTHLSIDEALAVVERLQPQQAYFTHMSHEVSHAAVSAILPPNVALAYDGLTITVGEARRAAE